MSNYIKRLVSPQREICQRLRSIILTMFPDISEELKGGVLCYGSIKVEPCGKFDIVALEDHINLGFSLKGLTKQQGFFEGGGKTMKHRKVYSVDDIDEKTIIGLLKMIR